MALSRWRVHAVQWEGSWQQVIEFKDPRGSLSNTHLRLGHNDHHGKGPLSPDDGSVPLSNAANQSSNSRETTSGLSASLHRSTVSEALLLRDPQPATAVGTGCLFVDKATGKLSYTDARNEAHALY